VKRLENFEDKHKNCRHWGIEVQSDIAKKYCEESEVEMAFLSA